MSEQISKGLGWREAFDSGMYAQQKVKRDQAVQDKMAKLAEMPTFTFAEQEEEFRSALREMEDGLTTGQRVQLFADRMSGGTVQQTLDKRKEDVRRRLRILGEFNEHERRLPKLLHRKAREAIAQKLGIETKWVEDVIFQFQLQYAQWSFLRREKLRGRPIPTTSDELESRLRLKPTREFIEVMNLIRRRKQQLEEERPSYVPPPREMNPRTRDRPLKIRPYISSAHNTPDRRKPPMKPYKRHSPSRLLY